MVKIRKFGVVLASLVGLAGCVTTDDANLALQTQWIGQSSEQFFATYGAPYQQFPLQSGGTNYSWRGGARTINVPAQYRQAMPGEAGYVAPGQINATANQPLLGQQNTRTTTTVSNPNPNTTVTRTTTTSSGFAIGNPATTTGARPGQVLVRPASTRRVFCEAAITTNPSGIITAFNITRDTQGTGTFTPSRCAEMFRVSSS